MSFNLVLFLCLFLPFFPALNPLNSVDLASIRVFVLGFFLFWAAEGLRKKKVQISLNAVTTLVVVFLFFNLFSIFFAENIEFAGRKLLFLFSLFPLYFVVSDVVSSDQKNWRVFEFLFFGAIIVSLISITQFFSQFIFGLDAVYSFWAEVFAPPFLGKNVTEAVLSNPSWLVNVSGHTFLRGTATFPDPHMLSFYLGMIAPMGLVLAIYKKKFVYWVGLGLILAADFLTFSRGGYLGLASVGLLMLPLFFQKVGRKYQVAIWAMIFLLVVAVFLPSPISSRFSSIFDLKEGSNQGRLETWVQAVGVISEKPLFGTGIGNYPLAIKPIADYREPIYAHSLYLDVAAETGILNGLAVVALLFSAFGANFKKAKDNLPHLGLALSLLVFSVHSLVETALYSPVILTLLLIVLGLCNMNNKNDIP